MSYDSPEAVAAAKGGNKSIETLDAIYESGGIDRFAEFISHIATKEGNLDIVKWLEKKGLPIYDSIVTTAIMEGHSDIAVYAIMNDFPMEVEDYIEMATTMEQSDVLKALNYVRRNPKHQL